MLENTNPCQQLRVLGVMAKYWTPGQVKTRLGQTIGPIAAAEIHHQFVLHLAGALRAAADRRIFAIAPTDRINEFQAELPAGWEVATQADGDLGRRIEAWFQPSLTAQSSSPPVAAVLIGADCPCLGEADIDSAFQQLSHHDVVLGPAPDGGYYLIGLGGPWRDAYQQLLVDIPWSSDQVYAITADRIEHSGLSLAVLPEKEDVDTINELTRLRQNLSIGKSSDRQLGITIDAILGAT